MALVVLLMKSTTLLHSHLRPQFYLALTITLVGGVWKHMSWNLVPATCISWTNHSKLHKPSEPSSSQLEDKGMKFRSSTILRNKWGKHVKPESKCPCRRWSPWPSGSHLVPFSRLCSPYRPSHLNRGSFRPSIRLQLSGTWDSLAWAEC